MTELDHTRDEVGFESLSGPLSVTRDGDLFTMDFPAWRLKRCDQAPKALLDGLGKKPIETWLVDTDDNYYAVYETEGDVREITPDFELLKQLHPAGVVVTAPGDNADCASRYFAPSYGISEDPATGSIHCGLTPYWAKRLGRSRIEAHQVSKRGAVLLCEDRRDRVTIAGRAVKYLEGTISV